MEMWEFSKILKNFDKNHQRDIKEINFNVTFILIISFFLYKILNSSYYDRIYLQNTLKCKCRSFLFMEMLVVVVGVGKWGEVYFSFSLISKWIIFFLLLQFVKKYLFNEPFPSYLNWKSFTFFLLQAKENFEIANRYER